MPGKSNPARREKPMAHQTTSFDEDGRPILITDFDWEEIERNLASETKQLRRSCKRGEITREQLETAMELCGTLLRWVWNNGKRDKRGVAIRSLIICWLYLDELRPLTEAQLARGFGLKKQSVGRWVEQFKKEFPMFKSPQLQHTK